MRVPTPSSSKPHAEPTQQQHAESSHQQLPVPAQQHHSVNDLIDLSDDKPVPSSAPAPVEKSIATSGPKNELQAKVQKQMPPPALLTHKEPNPRSHHLQRIDSETQEVEQFHDAQS